MADMYKQEWEVECGTNQQMAERIEDVLTDENGIVTFQGFAPMPSILGQVVANHRRDGERAKIDNNPGGCNFDHCDATDKEMAAIQATGFKDWYDWQCHNWGTKWGPCEGTIKVSKYTFRDGTKHYTVVCHFESAWGPPERAKEKFETWLENEFDENDYELNCWHHAGPTPY